MLKFLFGRYSRVVRVLEVVGLAVTAFNLSGPLWTRSWQGPDTLVILLLLQYGFVRTCRGINWYPEAQYRRTADPELGIEVHFLKALVPTSYILAASSILFCFGLQWTSMILANLMLFVVSGVNGILITFHWRDDRPLPVNYFTRNLYLQAAETAPRLPVQEQEVSAA